MAEKRVIRKLSDFTAADWLQIDDLKQRVGVRPADFALDLLDQMKGKDRVSEIMGVVDTYTHSLQVASRAHRDGADEEMVVIALLHDLFDLVAPTNHDALAAEFLRPYISEANYWMVAHHGIFQLYYMRTNPQIVNPNMRDQYREHPAYERTLRFCEHWDEASFDPDYAALPVTFFEPMVQRVLASPKE